MEILNGYVLTTPVEEKKNTGLILNEAKAHKELIVVQAAEGSKLKVYDIIYVPAKAGSQIPIGGVTYTAVKEGDIMLIL